MKIAEYRQIREHLETARDIIASNLRSTIKYRNDDKYLEIIKGIKDNEKRILFAIIDQIDMLEDNLKAIYYIDIEERWPDDNLPTEQG